MHRMRNADEQPRRIRHGGYLERLLRPLRQAGRLHAQSYDEKLESMTGFIIKTQGFDLRAARDTARKVMRKLPAWAGH